jgi:integral membrane protein
VTAALLRYRIAAYVVGLLLLGLVGSMYLEYVQDDHRFTWIALVHGWFYLVYLGLAFDLYRRAQWPGKVMALMIAGGLVPGLVFYVERRVAKRRLPPPRPPKKPAPAKLDAARTGEARTGEAGRDIADS